ncbi:MAG: carbohydrate ABC transporter permease [Lachnospiraceae bacterium]|nr:carbohydrate ABC transporter permease [Lachnospiraceae bacterium]
MTSRAERKAKRAKFWERNRACGGYLLRKKIANFFVKFCMAVLLFGMCFMIVQPLLQKISISLMEEQDLYNTTVISIPEHFTTYNYEVAYKFIGYKQGLIETVAVCLSASILQVAICTLVGYGFARFEFPLKKFWFACVILVIIVPPQTISTSLHLHFRYFDIFGIIKAITGNTLNLKGSMLPYYMLSATCMGLKNGLYIFLIRQFFRTIPKELEEAAYVDGAGTMRTFFRIMLPDSKPILTSCFLFSFVWQWTDSFYTRLFLGNVHMLGLQLNAIADRLMAYLVDKSSEMTNVATSGFINCIVSTATLMVIAPVLILYLFAQRGFVESLSSSGIKM